MSDKQSKFHVFMHCALYYRFVKILKSILSISIAWTYIIILMLYQLCILEIRFRVWQMMNSVTRILMRKMMCYHQIHVVHLKDQRNIKFVILSSQRNIQSECNDAIGVKKQKIQKEHVENQFKMKYSRRRVTANLHAQIN